MVLFTSGSSLSWGNLQVPCEASPPGICLLSIPNNQLFTSLQRFMMTEFKFFANREERWGDSMRALWGNITISHGGGTALVWISPYQAWTFTMEEALGILSTFISSGPNWPYVLTQLYEGANHVPLLKDKHLSILPQGKVERPCGQISQLEVHQLLSARLQVVYPVGLNGGNQSVTIDLPGPLHSGSSITTDEHPYIKIDIPSPTPEEQDHTNLPLGRVHTTLAVAMPKTPWKPRIIRWLRRIIY